MHDAELVRSAFAAFRRGDVDALRELLHPDAEWGGPDPGPGDCRGRDAVLARVAEAGATGFELEDVIDGGTELLVEVSGPAYAVVTVRAGRIARVRGQRSRVDALATAGLGPTPGPAPPERTEPGWDEVHDLVPFVHVADVDASIAFYGRLGFTVLHTHPAGDEHPSWAWLERGRARLMLARADMPVDRERQSVLFYLYAHDLYGLRERLVAAGVAAGEIADGSPGPRTEMRLEDPDGYVLMIAQVAPGEP